MSVDPRWQRVQNLLEVIEEVPASDQRERLWALEPDASLRQEVMAMLAAMQQEQSASPVPKATPGDDIPTEIGPYRILRKLGSGGCSVVYLGSRKVAGLEQQVAIKVMRDSLGDSSDLARFKREQGILARLDHPSIARFLDAGAGIDGKPYLVMEYVDGEPIDTYCRRFNLGEKERLQLIARVLDALQAAHQNLVVHLDLKPSNILVDRQGHVKMVDFGTAKLLQSQTDWTTTRQLTPSYASPEQLRGEALSTLSDIYSIGLTLQELVAEAGGPKPRASLASIAERAYGRNSMKTTSIRRDLDAVVFKALEAESRLRYQSAADFAADLRAILDRRPVIARKPTLQYRVGRFVARNRGGVSLVALLLVALLILAGYSALQYTQRLEEAERSAAIADFLRTMIESSSTANSGEPSLTVVEMIRRAAPRVEQAANLPLATQAGLQSSFAYVAREAGREDLARDLARRSIARADQSGDPVARLVSRQTLGEITLRLGDCSESIRLFNEAESMLEAARPRLKPAQLNAYLIARANVKSRCETNPQAALELYQRAASIPGITQLSVAGTAVGHALELARLGRNAEAVQVAERGLVASRQAPEASYFEVALERILSQVERKAGNRTLALAAIDRAIRLSPGRVNRFEELRLHTLRGGILAEMGESAEARAEVTATLEKSSDAGPSRWMLVADAAEVYSKIGDCELAAKTYADADALNGGKWPRDWLGNRQFYSAECASKTNPTEAARLARAALATYGNLLGEKSERRTRLLVLANPK